MQIHCGNILASFIDKEKITADTSMERISKTQNFCWATSKLFHKYRFSCQINWQWQVRLISARQRYRKS